ncbi:ATP-binding protein [Streptomyces sp. NPDC005805]|uniref:ATP-binding protein n=1 Tax=Streptomyces sp. NPDC005805 TaxID=3157068 RepID=UPI0033C986B4
MNHATDAREPALGPGYRAEMAVGEHSARHLRRILRTYLVSWGIPDVCDAAELALTELIANVVRHVPGRRCQTLVTFQDGGVRVEVSDGSPVVPSPGRGDVTAEDGRGLLLVDAVTDRWGVLPHRFGPPGKTVWFECMSKLPGADA